MYFLSRFLTQLRITSRPKWRSKSMKIQFVTIFTNDSPSTSLAQPSCLNAPFAKIFCLGKSDPFYGKIIATKQDYFSVKFTRCIGKNVEIDRRGNVKWKHIVETQWDFVTGNSSELTKLAIETKSYKSIYWKIWGLINVFHCSDCGQHYQVNITSNPKLNLNPSNLKTV